VAFNELIKDKFTFSEDKMQQYCGHVIPMDYDGMGLLQVESDLLYKSCYRTFSFLHRTVQEFAAAWHLTLLPHDEQRGMVIDIFTDILQNKTCSCEVAMVFYAGLTNLEAITIETIISAAVNINHYLHEFYTNACWFISHPYISWAHPQIYDSVAENFSCALIHYNLNKKFTFTNVSCETLLFLITCCAEAQNPAACRKLCSSNLFYGSACYILVPNSALTPQVLSSLSYCIVHSGKSGELIAHFLHSIILLAYASISMPVKFLGSLHFCVHVLTEHKSIVLAQLSSHSTTFVSWIYLIVTFLANTV